MACDNCGQWFHADCQSIGSSYADLDATEAAWNCLVCGNKNYSTIVFDLHGLGTSTSPHSYPNLSSTSTSDEPFHPHHTSTPTRVSRQGKQKNRPLRLLNINFRSVVGKVAELATMLECTRPDIRIGTETWTDSTIGDSELFPSTFKLFRKDRNRGGGGVLIAVTEDLVCTRDPELETDCEAVSGSK